MRTLFTRRDRGVVEQAANDAYYQNYRIIRELLNFGAECESLDWLFTEEFKEHLFERKDQIAVTAETRDEYRKIMTEINKIVRYLWDRKETHEMGIELDCLVGSLMGLYSSEFYAQGLKDGYHLARLPVKGEA